MEYKDIIATSEAGVADLTAKYVEDTFQPLQEPDLDYSLFAKTEWKWQNAQIALNNSLPLPYSSHTQQITYDPNPFNITWIPPPQGINFFRNTLTQIASPTQPSIKGHPYNFQTLTNTSKKRTHSPQFISLESLLSSGQKTLCIKLILQR